MLMGTLFELHVFVVSTGNHEYRLIPERAFAVQKSNRQGRIQTTFQARKHNALQEQWSNQISEITIDCWLLEYRKCQIVRSGVPPKVVYFLCHSL